MEAVVIVETTEVIMEAVEVLEVKAVPTASVTITAKTAEAGRVPA